MDTEERYFPSACSAGKYYDINDRSKKYIAYDIQLSSSSKRFHCWVSLLFQQYMFQKYIK